MISIRSFQSTRGSSTISEAAEFTSWTKISPLPPSSLLEQDSDGEESSGAAYSPSQLQIKSQDTDEEEVYSFKDRPQSSRYELMLNDYYRRFPEANSSQPARQTPFSQTPAAPAQQEQGVRSPQVVTIRDDLTESDEEEQPEEGELVQDASGQEWDEYILPSTASPEPLKSTSPPQDIGGFHDLMERAAKRFNLDVEKSPQVCITSLERRQYKTLVQTVYCLYALRLSCLLATYWDARACSDCALDAICQPNWNFVTCVCMTGFAGNGFECNEISACADTGCCPSGYTWDDEQGKESCVDLNECTDPSLNKCSPPSICVNVGGTYVCSEDRKAPCNVYPCDDFMDCLNVDGNLKCTDPCSHYQELNGENRMSNVSSSGRFLSDRSLYGWYRYMGSAGVRMKEGCIGGLRCGSAEPFTLAGAHPALGAGIRTVPVQLNKVSGDCTHFGSILIKACPGNFYVYKFSGSPRSEVFCTDWKS
ncbi:uncharacterized protein LOC144824321 [Lissotriton helveticus]